MKRSNVESSSSGYEFRIKVLLLVTTVTLSCLLVFKSANDTFSPWKTYCYSSTIINDTSFENRSSSISFKQVLENASTENRTVIITTLNRAWAEPNSLFDLFLESFRIGQGTQKLLKHVVVVCLDHKAFDRCSKLHPNCYYLQTSGVDFSAEKRYATPDYRKMMWRRIEHLTQVLEMGYNFIFTDTDIMWLRDPFPRLYPDADFQIACDRFFGDTYDARNWVNGGFTYVKSNQRSIKLYKFWYQSRLNYPGLHNQDVFNKIKHDRLLSEIGIKMRFFDTVYFGGFCQTSRDINLVCTMHANCCIGLEKKLHDLNLVLDDWRKYISLGEQVKNTTWSAPKKC